jgi:hypothetical protein
MATYRAGSIASPDGNYLVQGHIRGAYGRAFIDQTAKTAFVTISAQHSGNQKPLLRTKYILHGSDVCWNADWDKHDNLTLVFYDYGPGVNFYDARKNGNPERHIRSMTYRFDPTEGRFVEQSAK